VRCEIVTETRVAESEGPFEIALHDRDAERLAGRPQRRLPLDLVVQPAPGGCILESVHVAPMCEGPLLLDVHELATGFELLVP